MMLYLNENKFSFIPCTRNRAMMSIFLPRPSASMFALALHVSQIVLTRNPEAMVRLIHEFTLIQLKFLLILACVPTSKMFFLFKTKSLFESRIREYTLLLLCQLALHSLCVIGKKYSRAYDRLSRNFLHAKMGSGTTQLTELQFAEFWASFRRLSDFNILCSPSDKLKL